MRAVAGRRATAGGRPCQSRRADERHPDTSAVHAVGAHPRRSEHPSSAHLLRARPVAILATGLTLAACSRGGLAPDGTDASRIFDVTVVLTIAAVVVSLGVVVAWIWAVRRPGRSDIGADVDAAEATAERRLVLGGGIVMPAVVMAVLLGFGLWTMDAAPQQGDLEIEVVGHQYWWEVVYRDGPGVPTTFRTANQIRVPVDTDVTMVLRSDDVIHSFFVPQLAGKVDLVPGRENTLTFAATEEGTYEGFCAEFCGVQHAWMKFEVVATTPQEFSDWADRMARPAADPVTDLQAHGQEVFAGNSCVGCHAISGVDDSARIGPDLTHLASRDEIGAGVLGLDEENLADWIRNAQAIKGGSRMPPQQLSDDDLDALVAYLLALE